MERDFMGIGGKDLLMAEDGSSRSSCTSSVLRPLPTKASSFQQFLPFKPSAGFDEKPKQTMPDHAQMSRFQPTLGFSSHHQMISQKAYRQGSQPYTIQQHPLQGANTYELPTNQPSLHLSGDSRMPPNSLGGSYFRVNNPTNGSAQPIPSLRQHKPAPRFAQSAFGCAVNTQHGAFSPRDKINQLPATAQLTIFYGGYVNVYDNVQLEKAQQIMFMAANSSKAAPNITNAKAQTPVQAPPKSVAPEPPKLSLTPPKNSMASPRSGFSSPISAVSHSAVHSASSSSSPDERKGQAAALDTRNEPAKTPVHESSVTPSTTTFAKPVPMMRKLSLARFLEKRKERCTSISPYPPPNEKPFESGEPSKPSSSSARTVRMEIGDSSVKGWRWQSANASKEQIDGSGNPPNTKLEI